MQINFSWPDCVTLEYLKKWTHLNGLKSVAFSKFSPTEKQIDVYFLKK